MFRKKCTVVLIFMAVIFITSPLSAQSQSVNTRKKETLKDVKHEFCDSLMGLLMTFFPDTIKKCKIAIYPFQNKTGDVTSARGTWISEYFVTLFKKNNKFDVIKKRPFRQGIRSLEISLKELIEDSLAVEAARPLKADFILAGTVSPSDGNFEIAARIIDVKTAVITTGAAISATAEEIDKIETDLLAKRSKGRLRPAVLRSSFLPGWGQFYRQRPIPGIIGLVACATSLGATFYYGFGPFAEAKNEKEDFLDYNESDQFNRDVADLQSELGITEGEAKQIIWDRGEKISDDYDKEKARQGALIGLTAGLWTLNVIDVIIAGRQLHRKHRLYFTGDFKDEAGVMLAISF